MDENGFRSSEAFQMLKDTRHARRVCFDDIHCFDTIECIWTSVRSGLAPLPERAILARWPWMDHQDGWWFLVGHFG